MAAVDQQLFWELKHRYPEVPDHIVTRCMTQLSNNRERCMEMLTHESPRYLFGAPNSDLSQQQLPHALPDLNIGDQRPRSDSSGSNMSNASSSSSSSRPQLAVNRPGYRGPITTFEDHTTTAPNLHSEMNQVIWQHEQKTAEIPNIFCNNGGNTNSAVAGGHGYDLYNRPNFQASGYAINPSGNNAASASPAVLRQIDVQHIQTENRESPTSGQQSVTYRFKIPEQSVPSQGWMFHQVNPATPYQNVTYPACTPDMRSLPINQHQSNNSIGATSAYKSPSEEQPVFGVFPQGAYGQQRSSQATIFLTNPTGQSQPFSTLPARPMHSPLPGHYNPGSMNDLHVSPNLNVNRSNSQPSPQVGITGPVVVEIKTPPQRPGDVQSQIKYFNQISGSPNSGLGAVGGGQPNVQSLHLAQMSPHNESPVPDSQAQTSVSRTLGPERPTVINFPGATSRDNGGGFLKCPPMPNECHVPGHPQHHGSVQKSHSVEGEHPVFGLEGDFRPHVPPNHSQQPFMSPASSQSSLSSESSAQRHAAERPRSGSVDDPAYLQALLSHQKSRMDKLTDDLKLAEDRLKHLKSDVTTLESHVIERKRQKSNVYPSSVNLAELRGDNLQLQADIQLMTREIDLYNNGTTPLGVLDPIEQQNFYNNMNTGQRGSIYASTTQVPKTYSSTVTTSVPSTGSTVTTPTRPPPEIPPQLPPREPRDVPPPLPPRIPATSQIPPAPATQPAVNSGDSDADGEQWSCSACTFLNHPALNKCECCEMPRMSVTSPVNSRRDVPDSYTSPATTPTT